MQIRTVIVTALAVVSVAAPAAQATIPSDHDGVSASKPSAKVNPKAKLTVKRDSHKLSCTNPYGYVPGGSSPAVARAIADAATRTRCR